MKKLAALSSVAILATAFATTQVDAKEHTVAPGESLWVIADKYDTTIQKIKKINHLESNLIVPNQKLEVLVNGKYEVKAGDTLTKIAKKLDIKVSVLKKLNNIKTSKALKPGQLLIVEKNEVKKIVKTVPQKAVKAAPVTQTPVSKTTPVAKSVPVTKTAPATATKPAVQQAPVQQAKQAPVQQTAAPAGNSSVDAHLRMIMQRESGGNPRAVNPAGYYGLFQFSPQTWAAVGGTGNPAQASEAEQWKRARMLYTQYGAQHWSTAY
ncbi:LysM peptidoglycan-binding domain-containing protein [Macrococcus equi]|uniref:LysM peptidoglycan-binding domain-containing protein n=1 Tax=Macrococcus equi TaxID=3395462 RepID=UPI0039BE4E9A